MADITIPAGKYIVLQVIGTGPGSNPPSPLETGSMVMTITPADASKVYVAAVAPDKFAFVPKSTPPMGGSVNFGFSFAGHDGQSHIPLPTILGMQGTILGAPVPPQNNVNLALINQVITDAASTPPPPDPGTNSATL
jgi:hypothetical protein